MPFDGSSPYLTNVDERPGGIEVLAAFKRGGKRGRSETRIVFQYFNGRPQAQFEVWPEINGELVRPQSGLFLHLDELQAAIKGLQRAHHLAIEDGFRPRGED